MKTSPEVNLIKSLYQSALKLRNESERMLFLAAFAGLGTITSIGVGFFAQLVRPGLQIFVLGTVLSSTILIPVSLLLGVNLWDKLKKFRALSGDEFAYAKYLREEYEEDIKEIQKLRISEADKKRLTMERYTKYRSERESLLKLIDERIASNRREIPPSE